MADAIATLTGPTMGTSFTVRAVLGDADAAELTAQLQAAVDRVDAHMSAWKPDSALRRFNRAAIGEPVVIPPEMAAVIEAGLAISRDTDGAFDMTLGRLVDLWGFGPAGRSGMPAPAAIAQALAGAGHRNLSLADGNITKATDLTLDLNAIAKGFGADELARVLLANGVTDFVAEIDGELRVSGTRPDGAPWRIAIALPVPGLMAAHSAIAPGTCAVATSGDYRRFFSAAGQHLSHSIDPRTGRPTQSDLASVTVLAPTCVRADALATALLVMGRERAAAWAEARAVPALLLSRETESIEATMAGGFEAYIVP